MPRVPPPHPGPRSPCTAVGCRGIGMCLGVPKRDRGDKPRWDSASQPPQPAAPWPSQPLGCQLSHLGARGQVVKMQKCQIKLKRVL